MPSTSLGDRRLPALVAGLVLALSGAAPASSAVAERVSLGSGPSSILELDQQGQVIRTYQGLQQPTDITPLADGSYLVADAGAAEVLAFDPDGTVRWRLATEPGLQRARPRHGGGLVLTHVDRIVLTDAARQTVWTLHRPGVRAAVELPNGNLLAAYNQDQGWLAEIAPDGTEVWRSPPRTRLVDGQWVQEVRDQTFSSVASLDVGPDGAIFTSDFDAHTLRLLSKDHQVLRSWGTTGGHFSDTRFGPSGELVAVAPENGSVIVQSANGSTQTWKSRTPSLPWSAAVTPAGTTLIGLSFRPENEIRNAATRRAAAIPSRPWHQHLGIVATLGAALALLIGLVTRWPEVRARWPLARPTETRASDAAPLDDATLPGRVAAPGGSRTARSTVLIAAGLAVLAVSLILAWKTGQTLPRGATAKQLLWFAAACATAAGSLRVLAALTGTAGTISSFSSREAVAPSRLADRGRTILLVVLSLSCVAGSLLVLRYRPQAEALAVSAWIAAQILLLCAALTGPVERPPGSARRHAWWIPALLVLGAALLRFWDLGHFPDFIHWDHGIYGRAALRFLRGEWKPFFGNEGSLSRPWIGVGGVLLGTFGSHNWVLRLTAAVSGVMVVLGTYLLGGSLFNRRVGACAALLAAVNHVLLLYSRQPYVLDPAPFFVWTLYFASVGFKRGSRLHWCLSGLTAGWMMLTYWSATALAVAAAAILAAFVIFYPGWAWRRRIGLGWLVLGGLVTYLPMLPGAVGQTRLSERMRETFAIFEPDGSLRADPGFWVEQMRQAFGTILMFGDRSPWLMSTSLPIVAGAEAVLFGTGLLYLVMSGRVACVLPLLLWIGIGFGVGNGFFADPLVLYHGLGSIAPLLLVCGVAIDRLLALTDPWTSPVLRLVPRIAAAILLAFIASVHLRAAWGVVDRPDAPGDGAPILRGDLRSQVPLYIREHPALRYYLVRMAADLTCADPAFFFFADDSDVSDVTGELSEILPVAPEPEATGAAFVFLPARADEATALLDVYPAARKEALRTEAGEAEVYLIDAETVRRAYESAAGHDSGAVAEAAPAGGNQKVGPGTPSG